MGSTCTWTRPTPRQPDEFEPGCDRSGWQHEVASKVEEEFRVGNLFGRLDDASKALMRLRRNWIGIGIVHLSAVPSHPSGALFVSGLFRHLRLPLPLTGRNCRCGQPLDSSGHHRAACARAGVLGRRGFAVESVAARICREAGGRVTTNVLVRDMDLVRPDGPLSVRRGPAGCAPLWSAPSTPTAMLGETQPGEMEWIWKLHAGGRSALTRSSPSEEVGPGWSCWGWKWVADGQLTAERAQRGF